MAIFCFKVENNRICFNGALFAPALNWARACHARPQQRSATNNWEHKIIAVLLTSCVSVQSHEQWLGRERIASSGCQQLERQAAHSAGIIRRWITQEEVKILQLCILNQHIVIRTCQHGTAGYTMHTPEARFIGLTQHRGHGSRSYVLRAHITRSH